MAPTRKSAKRGAARKKGKAKRGSAKKSVARKSAARKSAAKGKRSATRKGAAKRRSTRAKTGRRRTRALKRTAEQGLKVAREGIDTVRQAGEKTWDVLRSTTAQVVEGVRDRLGDDSDDRDRDMTYR
jgi:hypothetical protein